MPLTQSRKLTIAHIHVKISSMESIITKAIRIVSTHCSDFQQISEIGLFHKDSS